MPTSRGWRLNAKTLKGGLHIAASNELELVEGFVDQWTTAILDNDLSYFPVKNSTPK